MQTKIKKLAIGIVLFPLISIFFSSCLHHREAFYFGNYSEAEGLFNRGQYDKAIQKYQGYIDENPEGHLAIISTYYIARSHAALGHKDEAKELFKQIIEKYPTVVWANFAETQIKELEAMPDKTPEPAKAADAKK